MFDQTCLFACYLYSRPKPHPAMRWKGMCPAMIGLDALHVLDHHGVVSQAAGSTLWEIVRDGEMGGATQADNLAAVSADLKAWYKNNPLIRSRLPNLRVKNFSVAPLSEFPELHGARVKATNTREPVGFFKELTQRLADGFPYKMHRARMWEQCHCHAGCGR